MSKQDLEALYKDISDRLAALDELKEMASEERLQKIVSDYFDQLLEDDEFVRKMRFGAGGGSDRKIVGTKFARWGLGIQDVEWLYDVLTSAQRVGISEKGPSEELRNTFQAVSDAAYVPEAQIREWDQQAIDNMFPRIPLNWFHGKDRVLAAEGKFELTEAYLRAVRAMDTAEAGYGAELIGAQYVGELWEGARKESRVFSLIDTFEMTAPTAYIPVEADLPELLFVPESTTSSASDYATSKSGSNRVQVDAKKFVIHQMWSGELEEDSILPFVPYLRRQSQLSLAHYSDSLVLNGDTTNLATGNINLDDADPADTKHYLAFDGIRHVGLVDNTNNQKDAAGALTYAEVTTLRKHGIDTTNLFDWGHPVNPEDFVFVAEPETADTIANLTEVLTVDKYGPQATVLAGEQARIGRNPLISSIAMSKTEADGKVSTTPGNNTLGQAVAFNRRGFKVGWRRRVKTEVERLPATDQTRLVNSLRLGFGRFSATGAASGIEAATVLFNVTIT
jgi:HK97 family phage major capsid protein